MHHPEWLNKLIKIALIALSASLVDGKTVVKGKTKNINTHLEIPNVNIYIKGSELGTVSGSNGEFVVLLPDNIGNVILVFKHIAYDSLELPLKPILDNPNVYLQPRVIPLLEVDIEAPRTISEIEKDLPQTISVFDASTFEIRGFIDVGDLLRADHSVQVTEEMSGKKSIAIRGGNSDEVVVLYNGIKMNSIFDNVFDLSQIDLNDIKRLEIIKGSNSVIYGSSALSGIVNIVPDVQKKYNLRFQQRFGTYNSGNWAVNLHQQINNLHGTYSHRNGQSQRSTAFNDGESKYLVNQFTHQTANIFLPFGISSKNPQGNVFSANYLKSDLSYENERDFENLKSNNRLAIMRYQGNIFFLKKLNFIFSQQQQETNQEYYVTIDTLKRKFLDNTININLGKQFNYKLFESYITYNSEIANLEYEDIQNNYLVTPRGLKSATFLRNRSSLAVVIKLNNGDRLNKANKSGVDISIRRDIVTDTQENPVIYQQYDSEPDSSSLFDKNQWDQSVLKFSSHFSHEFANANLRFFLNYGSNVKFPTLFQQISTPATYYSPITKPNLDPEKNTSMEIGINGIGQTPDLTNIYGWEFSANIFRNYYHNKFRTYTSVGIPVAYYDNVQNIKLSGIETTVKIYLFQKKIAAELGGSRYFISEKAAFPFKSEFKGTANLSINHAGYSLLFHWFSESEQIGWIQQLSDQFATEVVLPGFSNVDLHLSKTFDRTYYKIFTSFSARNILNSEIELLGFALRDRRYYLTIGVQI